MPLPRHLPLGRRLSFSLPPPRPSSSATATATHPRERRWVTTLSVCVAHTFEALLDKHWSTQFLFLLLLLLPSPFPPFLLTFCNRRLSSLSSLSLFFRLSQAILYVGKEICRQLFLLLFERGPFLFVTRTHSLSHRNLEEEGGRRKEAFAERSREELSIPFLHLVSFLLHSEIRRSFTSDFSGKQEEGFL